MHRPSTLAPSRAELLDARSLTVLSSYLLNLVLFDVVFRHSVCHTFHGFDFCSSGSYSTHVVSPTSHPGVSLHQSLNEIYYSYQVLKSPERSPIMDWIGHFCY
jgi:hypothetical protein